MFELEGMIMGLEFHVASHYRCPAGRSLGVKL